MPPRRCLVFLGAGASVPLGLPTMMELNERFEEAISGNTTHLKNLVMARTTIRANSFAYDIEALYSYLLGCASPYDSMKKAGPYAASQCYMQPISKLQGNPICGEMRELLEEHLIKECYFEGRDKKERARILFNRFFAKISGVRNWESSEPDWENTVFDVFTTNYDNTIETYGREVGQVPFVGYRKTEEERVLFAPELYEEAPERLRLYKLHGSVELSLLEDDSIIAVEPPKAPGEKHQDTSIKGKVMVYGPNKNLIAEPYFELLVHFKERLKNAPECIVVGYSFRDPWICQIFRDTIAYRRQRTPWIEYVAPCASYNMSKLAQLRQSVRSVDQSFEQYLKLPEEEMR